MAWLTIVTELVGGLSVLLGALVPLSSVPMAAALLVAMFSVHWRYGFSSIKLVAIKPAGAKFGSPGYECDLLYSGVLSCAGAFGVGTAFNRRGACAKNVDPPLISFESISRHARSFRPSSSDIANGFSVAKTQDLECSEAAKQPRRFSPDMVLAELVSGSGFRADP